MNGESNLSNGKHSVDLWRYTGLVTLHWLSKNKVSKGFTQICKLAISSLEPTLSSKQYWYFTTQSHNVNNFTIHHATQIIT